MKYFNPNYWFKLWILIGPFFNNKVQCTNTMSIDNEIDCNNTFDITSIKKFNIQSNRTRNKNKRINFTR